MTSTDQCRQFEPELVELALGTLSGLERASVLAHVQDCASCRDQVDRLSGAVDAMLSLAPSLEPPPGFETRLFERMGLTGARRRSWSFHLRRRVAAVAMVGVLGLSLGLSLGLGGGAPSPVPTRAIVATLISGQAVKGAVYLAPGNPGWLFMSVHGVRAEGMVSCRVRVNGRAETVGSFYLQAGSGSWAYALKVPTSEVEAAWLVDASGHVLAAARLLA
jgi:hypothetical protein